jgi:outer membrane protein assembly factor BamB
MLSHPLSKLACLQTLIVASGMLACLIAIPARADLGDELFRLTASDAAPDRIFGTSVAISGDRAIGGAPGPGGSAYLFDVTTGQELFKLTASDAGPFDQFGSSVAISGNRAIVGSIGGAGAAYLFDVTTGQELFKLTASDAVVGDRFGSSVAINGNTAIIAAVADENFSGSAYLFDMTTGQELFKLTASDAGPAEYFAHSVGISGNLAIVGAFGAHDGRAGSGGAAYVFDVTTGQEVFKLFAPDPAAGTFGQSVAISGNKALVGSPLIGSGSAYVFDVNTGQSLEKLTAPEAADVFGSAVAIDGDTAIVGAGYFHDDGFTGSAFLFDLTTGAQLAKLTPSDGAGDPRSDAFGESVAISANFAIVGSSGANRFTGAAYVYSAAPEPASLALLTIGLPLFAWRSSRRSGARTND